MSSQVSAGADNSIFNHELKAPVPRSVFDLSHIHTFSADFGAIIPFALFDCLPNDDFSISTIIKATTLPMVSPIYNAIKIRTYWFYTPYYLLWPHFDRFISGGRDGTYVADLPVVGDKNSGIRFNSTLSDKSGLLADYFNLPVNVQIPAADCPSAFPFMAYQRIYRDYFLNQDIQTDSNVNNWFPDDDALFRLSDGFQTFLHPHDNADDVSLLELRYRNWEKDYFTSAMFSPQRGDPVAMPVSLNGAGSSGNPPWLDWSDKATGDPLYGGIEFSGPADAGGPFLNPLWTNNFTGFSRSDVLFNVGYPHNAHTVEYPFMLTYTDENSGASKRFVLGINKNSLDGYLSSATGGFLIDDLRMATQLQLWLERNMRTKAQYKEFLEIHFNDSPVDLRLTKPYFIGGSTQIVQISDVLQTSSTTADSSLGQKAATGSSYDSTAIGRFHSHEYGLIMGLMTIMPDAMYTQGMARAWSRRSRFDFYFPEFAQLSPQAILNKELYLSGNTDTDNAVFGYQGRFDEFRFKTNYVTSLIRNTGAEDFYSYTLARHFDSTPSLSSAFISSEGTVRHDAFVAGTTLPPFIVQAGISVRATRPLPYVNQPSGLL